jgi:diadenylate cyclase
VPEFINNLFNNLVFIFERLTWLSVIDLILVAAVFFTIFSLLRNTQAMVLLRGALLLIALVAMLATLDVLPAFSWLLGATLPALVLAIPVIFAPEIRRALERLGRAGGILPTDKSSTNATDTIDAVVSATARLSERHHGALIVIQRRDNLEEYIQSGVDLDASVTAELLLQIFYPNTPLHDGAVIISDSRLKAASSVLPLSSSGVLTSSPDRKFGLRHRAALGISEVSDGVAIVVSEETGSISVVHDGRMIRRLDADRLENILRAFFRPGRTRGSLRQFLDRIYPGRKQDTPSESK